MKRPVDYWFECDSRADEDANLGGHESMWPCYSNDSGRAR